MALTSSPSAQKRQEILEIKAAIQRKNVDLNSATNAILKVSGLRDARAAGLSIYCYILATL